MRSWRRDPSLIGRSRASSSPDADADAADAAERQHAEAAAKVGREDAKQALSLMARLFGGAEHTPLYVITFLTIVCLVAWIVVAIWGPSSTRVDSLVDALGKAFTFFVGLFAGFSLAARR